jgi:hypothetical protein
LERRLFNIHIDDKGKKCLRLGLGRNVGAFELSLPFLEHFVFFNGYGVTLRLLKFLESQVAAYYALQPHPWYFALNLATHTACFFAAD